MMHASDSVPFEIHASCRCTGSDLNKFETVVVVPLCSSKGT